MISISLCMIVRNEEEVLGRCLDSAAGIVDEIIIVDTGSIDRTVEIARKYTNRIYKFDWIDDFAAARNFSFSKATGEYLLWLDADDVILSEDQEKFLKLKAELSPDVDVVMMPYHVGFDSDGHPNFTYERERLLKRSKNFQWLGKIHEAIPPAGKILHSEIAITHRKEKVGDPDRNLRIFEKILSEGQTLEPRQQYYYARELAAHGRDQEAIKWFSYFLQEGKGWIENQIGACQDLAECYFRLGDFTRAMESLSRSFIYGFPRAQICCRLADAWMQQDDLQQAIFWYQTALHCPPPSREGFCQPDYWDFVPYMQLCVCYDRLGQRAQALCCHEKAKRLKPYDPAVQYNEHYFYG